MSIIDRYFIPNPFKENALRYLFALQNIAQYKINADDVCTPYQFEMSRKYMHDRLFRENILPMLKCEDEQLSYMRSKEIFANLDKVWKIYDETLFDITNDECVTRMVVYLWELLNTTECRYFLEGKTVRMHCGICDKLSPLGALSSKS